ncbi:hypothetical protein ACFZC5_08695 [Nocardia gamkensis]|uniref:hypothetical protein n=1 Tax=Nocardia gamkensis TaxID=352869 RepID=UPI0036EBBFCF
MTSTERHVPLLAAAESATEVSPEAAVVWPDPSPLEAWWQRIMHTDPLPDAA